METLDKTRELELWQQWADQEPDSYPISFSGKEDTTTCGPYTSFEGRLWLNYQIAEKFFKGWFASTLGTRSYADALSKAKQRFDEDIETNIQEFVLVRDAKFEPSTQAVMALRENWHTIYFGDLSDKIGLNELTTFAAFRASAKSADETKRMAR